MIHAQNSGPKPPTVKCPTCGTAVVFAPSEKFRPFCSERCRLIDLGEWATASYAIPCDSDTPDFGEPEPHSGRES